MSLCSTRTRMIAFGFAIVMPFINDLGYILGYYISHIETDYRRLLRRSPAAHCRVVEGASSSRINSCEFVGGLGKMMRVAVTLKEAA
ncbi:hypothetical protein CI102_10630 [Trichoderma harzianum]|nr:hypothetical protein CI102_10630 [Trichoderma harzianum]